LLGMRECEQLEYTPPSKRLRISLEQHSEEKHVAAQLIFPTYKTLNLKKYGSEQLLSQDREDIWDNELLETVIWPMIERLGEMGKYDDVALSDENQLCFNGVTAKKLAACGGGKGYKQGYNAISELVKLESEDVANSVIRLVLRSGLLPTNDAANEATSSNGTFETYLWLYDMCTAGFEKYINLIVLYEMKVRYPNSPAVLSAQDQLDKHRNLLRQLVVHWIRFKLFTSSLAQIFSQVDSQHSVPNMLPELNAVAFFKFRSMVYNEDMRRRILEARIQLNFVEDQESKALLYNATKVCDELDFRTSNKATRGDLLESDSKWVSGLVQTEAQLNRRNIAVPEVIWGHVLKFFGDERHLEEQFFALGQFVELTYSNSARKFEAEIVSVNERMRQLTIRRLDSGENHEISQYDSRINVIQTPSILLSNYMDADIDLDATEL